MFKHPSAVERSEFDSATFAPIVELFNHRAGAAVRSGFNQRRGTFEVILQAPVKKGDQIFIEYLDDADLDTIFIDYGFVLNASKSAILLDEKLVQETAAKLGFPNLKQLSRRAKELTERSRWRLKLDTVSQEAEAALLVYSCGHLDNVDELFQRHKNTPLLDLNAHKKKIKST
ncbi:Oidioi.mRNA.OKI2018_I69.XSR.g16251.t1.cds [Oikopleura dioica]|uniref:Oidioi.mRNA.OKI2018_I69.XSR.g16251.t1.cds n=1 Tax=Oikopleura dioica TaxID=34765 RepID=A0ABN7SKL8_OIKDI|nr:Oidioi.mRNA.OKI2018_I69.XSR.g16251.t1.cds [Oikopleura dioica]